MDKHKWQTLRDVLVERLWSGEDEEALRAQLVSKLSRDRADELIAEARVQLENSRGDPEFIRSLQEARERREARPALRRKPQRTRITAAVFGVLGLLMLFMSVLRGGFDTSLFITGVLFLGPAIVLWAANSLIAAGALVCVSGFGVVGSLIFLMVAGPLVLPSLVFMSALLAAAVRAFMIMLANRRLATESAPAEAAL